MSERVTVGGREAIINTDDVPSKAYIKDSSGYDFLHRATREWQSWKVVVQRPDEFAFDNREAAEAFLREHADKPAPPAQAAWPDWLDEVCELIHREKEKAVGDIDFDRASHWRDVYYQLKETVARGLVAAPPAQAGGEELPTGPGVWRRIANVPFEGDADHVIVRLRSDTLLWTGWVGDNRKQGRVDHLPRGNWLSASPPPPRTITGDGSPLPAGVWGEFYKGWLQLFMCGPAGKTLPGRTYTYVGPVPAAEQEQRDAE